MTHADGVSRCINPASQQMPAESDANGNDEELNANLCGNDIMAFIPKYMENSPLVTAA